MQKLIYIAVVFLTLTIPVRSFANESIDSQEFKYLVCSYIQDSESIDDAIDQIDLIADELDLNDSQEEIIEKIYQGELIPDNYCSGLEF